MLLLYLRVPKHPIALAVYPIGSPTPAPMRYTFGPNAWLPMASAEPASNRIGTVIGRGCLGRRFATFCVWKPGCGHVSGNASFSRTSVSAKTTNGSCHAENLSAYIDSDRSFFPGGARSDGPLFCTAALFEKRLPKVVHFNSFFVTTVVCPCASTLFHATPASLHAGGSEITKRSCRVPRQRGQR